MKKKRSQKLGIGASSAKKLVVFFKQKDDNKYEIKGIRMQD